MVAFAACIMLAGVAAAEYPDAGDTWDYAKSFDIDQGYNSVAGTLAPYQDPEDGVDCWVNGTATGSDLKLYLNSVGYNKCIKAEMFNDNGGLMQRVHKYPDGTLDNLFITSILNPSPVHVDISGTPGDGSYGFIVYKK